MNKPTSNDLRSLSIELASISTITGMEMRRVFLQEYLKIYAPEENEMRQIIEQGLFFDSDKYETQQTASSYRMITEHLALEWFVNWAGTQCSSGAFDFLDIDYPLAMSTAQIIAYYNRRPLIEFSKVFMGVIGPSMGCLINAINDAAFCLLEDEMNSKTGEVCRE